MGFALPGAIAAQLARSNQKVVAMCGDGGFLMNVQEIETAVRLKLPIIIIVWCDCDFGMISLKQIHEFGKSALQDLIILILSHLLKALVREVMMLNLLKIFVISWKRPKNQPMFRLSYQLM
jgi:thiamine pyrophosphate-dependent acetolactate synthase large subunit-like protein